MRRERSATVDLARVQADNAHRNTDARSPMTTDAEIDRRIDTFWRWFERNATAMRAATKPDRAEPDLAALEAVVAVLYEALANIRPSLLVDVQTGSPELTLAVRGSPTDRALVDRILARAPRCAGWRIVAELPNDLECVLARDESGLEVCVRYADLGFAFVGPASEETRTVLLVWNGDFDPTGPEAHLYDGAAQHAVMTLLGRVPPSVRVEILPARMAPSVVTRPVLELPDAWAAAMKES